MKFAGGSSSLTVKVGEKGVTKMQAVNLDELWMNFG